jgi:AcrR family transcriptional regulator
MPKVTDEYLVDKKNYILKCTGEILKIKPLYSVTMRDIIKKAGFSQGIIYHYYASLDEIYIDYINKNTTYNLLEQNIDLLLNSELTEKEILSECIIAIGKYIEELLKSVGGRTCFELTVLYAYDFEKRAAIFPKLKFKQSLVYAQNKILEYVSNNIEKGVFSPQIPIRSISMFVSNFIDGIAQSMATDVAEGNDSPEDISMMFQTLAKAVICFLEI